MSGDKGPPIANPTDFYGSDRTLTEDFIHQCELVINGKSGVFKDDSQRIAFILSYMKGPIAGGWAKTKAKNKDAATGNYKFTAEQLIKDISSTFAEVEQQTKHTAVLENLRQGNSSVDEYNSAFNRLRNATEFNDQALVAYYIKGLRGSIATALALSEAPPKTLDEWQPRAAKYEIIQQTYNKGNQYKKFYYPDMFQTKSGHHIALPTSSKQWTPSNYQNNTYMGEPMDVDAMKTRFKKLTDKERQEYMREGKCFRCRQKGHMSRNCPKNSGPSKGKYIRNRNVDISQQIKEMLEGANEDDTGEIVLAVHTALKAKENAETTKDF
jgi:hypothetical protein